MKSNFFAALATLSLSSMALATEARLEVLSTNGSGCPVQAGKTIPYGFDGQWLTVELNHAFHIKVEKGTGISLEESRKNCAITLDVQAPGYRYAVERVVTSVSYQLAPNDQFVASLNGFFAGDGATFSSDSEVLGPVWKQEDRTFDQTLNGSNLVWSECNSNRDLTLNTAVRVSPKGNSGRNASQSYGTLKRAAFRFIFQKCH
ncbi:MAG TPA: DUF4360 domain-containing protein [Oligoflexus sp.]|uniref:DUF4360 domain-containing protein n=1 Tax=Oligoflexus sp. TaxID=1971216 RepID=UPI002D2D6B35|nr:DUF4360 domain-containing protein [Oligoflexus sp.]HYX37538.1 DUF4360 domain-containing protein [Oligoflexus sp.]